MAQGEFTKEEADNAIGAVEEMFGAMLAWEREKFSRQIDGVRKFLRAAWKAAPDKPE